MSKCIKCGECNKTYIFLFLAIISSLLKDAALGSDNVATFQYLKFLESENISNCNTVRKLFCYFFSIIVAVILYKKESKYIGDEDLNKLDINNIDRRTTVAGDVELIHNEQNLTVYSNKKLILIIFLWVLEEQLLSIFKDIFLHLDFWMCELIIIHFFMKKMLKMKVYSHQSLMLWFCCIPFILKLVTILLSFNDEKNYISPNKKDNYQYSENIHKLKLIYVAIPWMIFGALPLYFLLITFRAFVNTKIKVLMDVKFISISKIFLLYNIIGFIFCLIICAISTFIPCYESKNDYTIYDYFCKVQDGDTKYFDNIIFYFQGLINLEKNYYQEIIALIFGIVFFILYNFFCLKIIQRLTPVHIIFSFPIFYVCNKTYLLFLNFFKSDKKFWYLPVEYAQVKLTLDFSSDFVSIIGYLIYLEIIELHFCRYDYNIRRNILDRCLLKNNKTEVNTSIKSGDDLEQELSEDQRSESESEMEEKKEEEKVEEEKVEEEKYQ